MFTDVWGQQVQQGNLGHAETDENEENQDIIKCSIGAKGKTERGKEREIQRFTGCFIDLTNIDIRIGQKNAHLTQTKI